MACREHTIMLDRAWTELLSSSACLGPGARASSHQGDPMAPSSPAPPRPRAASGLRDAEPMQAAGRTAADAASSTALQASKAAQRKLKLAAAGPADRGRGAVGAAPTGRNQKLPPRIPWIIR